MGGWVGIVYVSPLSVHDGVKIQRFSSLHTFFPKHKGHSIKKPSETGICLVHLEEAKSFHIL